MSTDAAAAGTPQAQDSSLAAATGASSGSGAPTGADTAASRTGELMDGANYEAYGNPAPLESMAVDPSDVVQIRKADYAAEQQVAQQMHEEIVEQRAEMASVSANVSAMLRKIAELRLKSKVPKVAEIDKKYAALAAAIDAHQGVETADLASVMDYYGELYAAEAEEKAIAARAPVARAADTAAVPVANWGRKIDYKPRAPGKTRLGAVAADSASAAAAMDTTPATSADAAAATTRLGAPAPAAAALPARPAAPALSAGVAAATALDMEADAASLGLPTRPGDTGGGRVKVIGSVHDIGGRTEFMHAVRAGAAAIAMGRVGRDPRDVDNYCPTLVEVAREAAKWEMDTYRRKQPSMSVDQIAAEMASICNEVATPDLPKLAAVFYSAQASTTITAMPDRYGQAY